MNPEDIQASVIDLEQLKSLDAEALTTYFHKLLQNTIDSYHTNKKKDSETKPDDKQLDELNKLLNQQWRQIAFQIHPDKSRAEEKEKAEATFKSANNAYTEIQKKIKINFRSFDIPETAFDLTLMSNIEQAYQEIHPFVRTLEDDEQQDKFNREYGDFLCLAQLLEQEKDQLLTNRGKYVGKNGLLKSLIQDVRKLILQLYAEEFLDDFEYRHAIAHGIPLSMLAKRKLISPVKLLTALVNSILLCFSSTLSKINEATLQNILANLQTSEKNQQNGQPHAAIGCLGIAKLIAYIGSILLLITNFPELITALMIIPVLTFTLQLLACPVNNIVRPLAKLSSIKPEIIAILGCAAIASVAAAVFACAGAGYISSIALSTIFPYATIILSLANFIAMLTLAKNIHATHQGAGITVAALSVFLFVKDILFTPVTFLTNSQMMRMLLDQFIMLCIVGFINHKHANAVTEMNETIAAQPLPETPVPEKIKQATLQGNKIAAQSARLFNTPSNARFLTSDERTFTQCASSLFGGGSKSYERKMPGRTPQRLIANHAHIAVKTA